MEYFNLLPVLDRFAALPVVFYRFLITKNNDWRFVYVSPEISSLYEIQPQEAYSDHMVMTSIIHPDDAESHRRSVEACFKEIKPWRHDHRIMPKSGVLKWVRAQAVPEKLSDGGVQWNGVLTDITDLKTAEQQLLKNQLEKQKETFAHHIHDEIGSRLFGASMMLSGMKSESTVHQLQLETVISEIELSIRKIRNISCDLVSQEAEIGLLSDRIKNLPNELLGDINSKIEIEATGDFFGLDSSLVHELLMIAREATLNSIKHGMADKIKITAQRYASCLDLCICDDGKGFDIELVPGDGVGLRSMRARALKINALLTIKSQLSEGTSVMVSLMLE